MTYINSIIKMDIKIDLLHHLVNKSVIKKFEEMSIGQKPEVIQEALKGIKKWNVSELDTQVTSIKNRSPNIEELVFSVILDIERSLHDGATRRTLDINLFIHRIYINMGGFLYLRPRILAETYLGDKKDKIEQGLRESIKKSLFDIFPVVDVLSVCKTAATAVTVTEIAPDETPPVTANATINSSDDSDDDAEECADSGSDSGDRKSVV